MPKNDIYASERMGNHNFVHVALWSAISVVLICCHPPTNRTQVKTPGIDSLVLMDSAQENYSNLFAGSTAFTFYKSRSFVPVWLKNKTKTILADSMINLIR